MKPTGSELVLVRETAKFLRTHLSRASLAPRVAAVLGSGLGGIADGLADPLTIPFSKIPNFPEATVKGHSGVFVAGRIGGVDMIALKGRFHYYEGHEMRAVVFPVRVLRALGIDVLLLTNAAGAIRADLAPGDLMLMTDHINFMGTNPLRGRNDEELGPRFPDVTDLYDPGLRGQIKSVAKRLRIPLKEGVYIAVSGPSYETKAEIRAFKSWGADAVGMSTAPEAVAARHAGIPRILGLSVITNYSPEHKGAPVTHQEVVQASTAAGPKVTKLLAAFLPKALESGASRPGALEHGPSAR